MKLGMMAVLAAAGIMGGTDMGFASPHKLTPAEKPLQSIDEAVYRMKKAQEKRDRRAAKRLRNKTE